MRKGLVLFFILVMLLDVFFPVINIQAETKTDIEVVFFTDVQKTNTLKEMIEDYNDNFAPSGESVKLQTSTWETESQHDTYATKFADRDSSFDIVSMDLLWSPEFVAAGWLEPLDGIINEINEDDFLSAQIEAGIYQGRHYGVPWFHNSAMLFYREDIIGYAFNHGLIPRNGPPETWDELHDWTLAMLNDTALVAEFEGDDDHEILEGFIWQGKQHEGLMCNFMEYLGGTGQYTFLNADQTAANVNTPNMRDALEFMKSLFVPHQGPTAAETISVSPIAVFGYYEKTSREVWNAGNAIFHRNWAYCYRLSMLNSFINGTDGGTDPLFEVAVMPHKTGVTEYRTSCLGGWQLGLNIHSTKKPAAKRFIRWLAAAEQQKTYLLGNGNIPTLEAVYSDPEVLTSDQAYVNILLPIFKKALPRPVHPRYQEMSAALWVHIQEAFVGHTTIDVAITVMEDEINEILKSPLSSTSPTQTIFPIRITSGYVLISLLLSFSFLILLRKRKHKDNWTS